MFDNLRDLVNDSFDASQEEDPKADTPFEETSTTASPPAKAVPPKRRRQGKFLGMTAPQRFVLSVMLMFTVLLLGMLVMLVFGKMSLPF